jgi:hypothetical protein
MLIFPKIHANGKQKKCGGDTAACDISEKDLNEPWN